MPKPLFSISILALNNLALTRRCVESVVAHTNDFELLLTDNGSNDGIGPYFDHLAEALPNVSVAHNKTNLGFQEPNKLALERARGEFFVLLNNDTVVCDRWLEALTFPFHDPSVAATGPAGNCCSIRNNFFGYGGRLFEYLEGSCMVLRTEAVREIGLFSPYVSFAYGEDSDLCLRLRYAGYKIARVRVPIEHRPSSTSKKVPGIREHLFRNCATLQKVWKHYLTVRKVNHPIIVKRAGAIGDVLLTTAVTRALAEQRKTCHIYVETQFPQLFDRNSDVKGAATSIPMRADAQVIDLNMSYENCVDTSILDAYQDTAAIVLNDRRLHYTPSQQALERVRRYIPRDGDPVCVIAPGPTTWPGKNWSTERFAFIADWLIGRGWHVILVGGKGYPGIPCSMDTRGQTDFDQSAAIMSQAQIFVGLDSFPLHLAMSQRLPVVGIFGATLPQFILSEGVAIGVHGDPSKVSCIGARHRNPGTTFVGCNGECMRAVSVEMVQEAIKHLIGET